MDNKDNYEFTIVLNVLPKSKVHYCYVTDNKGNLIILGTCSLYAQKEIFIDWFKSVPKVMEPHLIELVEDCLKSELD